MDATDCHVLIATDSAYAVPPIYSSTAAVPIYPVLRLPYPAYRHCLIGHRTGSMSRPARTRDSTAGFTLIEIMVSLVILAVAMLGIAGIHGLSTRYTNKSYFRSQAVNQAYDILDRMRANPDGFSTGDYSRVFSSNTSAGNCLLSSCSPSDLASFDLGEWNDLNRSVLPSGSGFVTVEGFNVSVVVRWIEDTGRNGENKPRSVKVTVQI